MDLLGYDRYTITIISGLESQDIDVTNSEEAFEAALRLRQFLPSSYEVVLVGKVDGVAKFDDDNGEYLYHVGESEKVLEF